MYTCIKISRSRWQKGVLALLLRAAVGNLCVHIMSLCMNICVFSYIILHICTSHCPALAGSCRQLICSYHIIIYIYCIIIYIHIYIYVYAYLCMYRFIWRQYFHMAAEMLACLALAGSCRQCK